jgi:predicted phosphodiesterase
MGIKWWSDDEVAELRKLRAEGKSLREIALLFKRSFKSVERKVAREDIKFVPIEEEPPKIDPKEIERREQDRMRLESELKRRLENYHDVSTDDFFRGGYRFIACGDNQFGSRYDRHDLIEKMFEIAQREGISDIYHTGDFFDGFKVYAGQEYEQDFRGADEQLEHGLNSWPKVKGIRTRLISGNHDNSFVKRCNFDICQHFVDARPDCELLGRDQAVVPVDVDGTTIKIGLLHPDGGSSYALSYKSQKHVESISGGQKPHILLIGHYHKAVLLPSYRSLAVIQTGCLQSQTPFMRRRGLAAHLGFWIVEVRTTKVGLARVATEFIPFFEAW